MAAHFFTIEVWIPKGLQRVLVLLLIELSTRKVEIAGIASAANGDQQEPERVEDCLRLQNPFREPGIDTPDAGRINKIGILDATGSVSIAGRMAKPEEIASVIRLSALRDL